MKVFYYSTIIFFTALFMQSCKDEYTICNLPKDARFIAGFYQRVGNADVTALAPNLSLYSLNGANLIYSNQTNLSTFSLPLSSTVDTSRYVLILGTNLQSDTLTIVYSSQLVSLSPECGSVTYNNINKLWSTYHTIDSVKIINPTVNTSLSQNAKIYF